MDEITAEYVVAEIREAVPLQTRIYTTVAAKTDLGRVRENNEDKFEFYEPSDENLLATRGKVYVVCDGMGGHSAGQIASELATKTFLDVFLNHPSHEPEIAGISAANAANRFVYDVGCTVPGRKGMGTTLTALALIQDRGLVIQVGDSRLYRLRQSMLEQITTDHTWVEDVVSQGLLTREEAENHQYRHVITRAIGTEANVPVDHFWIDLEVGDIFLLCSDGLTGHVSDAEIHDTLERFGPAESCWQLVSMALAGGGSDNCTVLVTRVDDLQRIDQSPIA
ncbi:MAG: Stp1/IreP family PP2C-type Ser/Thr phosphatase [Armatimonadetes bacterium]|nr:Stp1/IreP family PP2C-type Ser/Thr phosphatase [Armatimonadota bacterium]